MAGKNQVTLTFAGDSDELEKSLKGVGDSAEKTGKSFKGVGDDAKKTQQSFKGVGDSAKKTEKGFKDSASGLDKFGERADDVDTKAMGFRDTITGLQDTFKGLTDDSLSLGDRLLTLGMGVGDLGSGIYNFGVPSLQKLTGATKAGESAAAAAAATQKTSAASTIAAQNAQATATVSAQARMRGAMAATSKFMVGPWGMAILGGALILGTLALSHEDTARSVRELSESESEFAELAKVGNFLLEERDRLNREVEGSLKDVSREDLEAAGMVEKNTAATKKNTDSVYANLESLRERRNELKEDTDPLFRYTQAQKRLTLAQKAYSDAVKEHGPKSEQARQAALDLAAAAIDTDDAARAAARGSRVSEDAIRDMGRAMNLSEDEVQDMINSLRKARAAARRLAGNYRVRIFYTSSGQVSPYGIAGVTSAGGYSEFALGGRVGGQRGRAALGGMRSDRVLLGEYGPEIVDLPMGSYVHNAAETRRQRTAGGVSGAMAVTVQGGAGGTTTDRAVASLVLQLIRNGALTLNVRDGRVVAGAG